MPQPASFDVTTGVDLQEVDNAVNQAQKEISQRYDFKGSPATIELNRTEGKIALTAENDYKMEALWDVLQTKLIKRSVPVKNLDPGEIKPAGGDTVRRDIALKMALDGDTAKESRRGHQGSQAQESPGGDSGRPGARHLAVARRPSGSDGASPREGLRRRAQVRELPLTLRVIAAVPHRATA